MPFQPQIVVRVANYVWGSHDFGTCNRGTSSEEARMSDEGTQSQSPQESTIWWWNGQDYRRIPPDKLDPATSDVALALSADEYPDLAELLIYADNGAAYLQSIGIEMDDDDNPTGAGEERSPMTT